MPLSAPPPDNADGPWNELWRATWRRPGTRWGLAVVALFLLVALLAPLLAHRLPFLWQDAATGEWSSPLAREFFAPTDSRETGLEAAANFSLLYLPLAWLAWKLTRRAGWGRGGGSRAVALLLAALASAALWYGGAGVLRAIGGASPWVAERHPSVDPDDLRDPEAVAAAVLAQAPDHPARRVLTGALRDGRLRLRDNSADDDADAESAKAGDDAAIAAFVAEHAGRPVAARRPDDDADRSLRSTLAGLLNDSLRAADFPAPPGFPVNDSLANSLARSAAEGRLAGDEAMRLHRFRLDALVPAGALRPARETRTGLVVAAALAVLSLAGVTLLLLTAANQMTADPRWLALLVLATLLALPFWRAKPFNETRRFRELAATGKGRGHFPPLPYGPSEDGFGPKLPPEWRQPPALLAAADVLPPPPGVHPALDNGGWDRLADWLTEDLGNGNGNPENPAAPAPGDKARRLLREKLPPATVGELIAFGRAGFDAAAGLPTPPEASVAAIDDYDPGTVRALLGLALLKPAGRDFLAARINALLEGGSFYDAAAFRALRVTGDYLIEPYLAARRPLDAREELRLNRLLFERAVPDAVKPAKAVHWKQPLQKAGVHWLGTDESGRDVLVRMLHGARVSLSVGFVSVALATLIGLALGALAAYYGGWVDHLVMRAIEVMMCFPTFFLILALIAVLEQRSILNIMLVLGLTGWTGVARLVRGEMLQQRALDYVAAARALGAPDTRIMFRHILPNAVAPVLVSVTFGITGAILSESGLSFLGLGVMPPTPSWGQLLAEAREAPLDNWWLALFPGLALFAGVFSYNLVGDGLRDALDPRNR